MKQKAPVREYPIFMGFEHRFGTKKDGSGTYDLHIVYLGTTVKAAARGNMNVEGFGYKVDSWFLAEGVDGAEACAGLEFCDEVQLETELNYENPNARPKVVGIRKVGA